MASSRLSLSIDLPPMLDFALPDGQLPKTPEGRGEHQSATEPPPPPQQKFQVKVKRRRAKIPTPHPMLPDDTDGIIPTIEMSESVSGSSSPILLPSMSIDGLLSPLPKGQRLVTPTTPCMQSGSFDQLDSPTNEWSLINDSRDQQRPPYQRSGSICTSFSDSSYESDASSAFSVPNGCTSPESVATDPFMEDDLPKTEGLPLPSSQNEESNTPNAKRQKKHRQVRWTPEMDQHLESTYIRYLSDPRVTPFKTLPGTAPPLGVCHRVAVKAKLTWSQHKVTMSSLDTVLEYEPNPREGSPDTIRPTKRNRNQQHSQWPRSDKATRRRLRKIVKSKPALSAHYQRLLHTRSPSPFGSSLPVSSASEPLQSAFSGRDLKVSLVSSTAPSMQPEGVLAQLATEEVVPEESSPRPQSQRSSRPADWFARIGRSQAHQKSLSLQSGLSIDTAANESPALLASPFDDFVNRSHLLHSMSTTKSLGRSEFKNKNGKVPSLDSPFEMKGAPTLPRSLKRRFKSDEEKPRRPLLGDVFGEQSVSTDEVRKIRNRGTTIGATSARSAHESLAKLFEPPAAPTPAPASVDHDMMEVSPTPGAYDLGPIGSRSVPRRLAEPVPRLRSPFEMPSTSRPFNTFPRNYVPTPLNPQPFHERIRELAAERVQADLLAATQQSSKMDESVFH